MSAPRQVAGAGPKGSPGVASPGLRLHLQPRLPDEMWTIDSRALACNTVDTRPAAPPWGPVRHRSSPEQPSPDRACRSERLGRPRRDSSASSYSLRQCPRGKPAGRSVSYAIPCVTTRGRPTPVVGQAFRPDCQAGEPDLQIAIAQRRSNGRLRAAKVGRPLSRVKVNNDMG